MSTVSEIEQAVRQLLNQDLATFRAGSPSTMRNCGISNSSGMRHPASSMHLPKKPLTTCEAVAAPTCETPRDATILGLLSTIAG